MHECLFPLTGYFTWCCHVDRSNNSGKYIVRIEIYRLLQLYWRFFFIKFWLLFNAYLHTTRLPYFVTYYTGILLFSLPEWISAPPHSENNSFHIALVTADLAISRLIKLWLITPVLFCMLRRKWRRENGGVENHYEVYCSGHKRQRSTRNREVCSVVDDG